MIFLKYISILILALILGLSIEKMLHMQYSLKQLVHQLKSDMYTIIKALFSSEPIRHIFDLQLVEELKSVVREYALPTFDIDVFNDMYNGSPIVAVCFVPKNKLEKEQLEEASQYVLLKFKRYLMIHNLNWRVFVTYKKINEYVHIYIFYAEFTDDINSFNKNYKQAIKEKSDVDYGTLQDDDLNKELYDD